MDYSKGTTTTNYAIAALFCVLYLFSSLTTQAITVEITAVVPGCGNGVIDAGEQCDGAILGGGSCTGLGFSSGSLSCTTACTYNTSACVLAPAPGGGGGAGGGFVNPFPQIPNTNVVFSGRAYPRSVITLLKDAQVAATTVADANAQFQVTLAGISSGNYTFSVYSEDNKGERSSLLTFPIGVTAGVTTRVSDIFIAPTIGIDKQEVRRGDTLTIFGQTFPTAEVTINVNSEPELFFKRTADASGAYLLRLDTSVLEQGSHTTRSKSAVADEISSFSRTLAFRVGTRNVEREQTPTERRGDLNTDNRVNLVDFSILAFWYRKPNIPASVDMNGDGKVDLVDFSILAFNWTG